MKYHKELKCKNCGQVCGYHDEWTEDDAINEKNKLFPDHKNENSVNICDDCFSKFNILNSKAAI